MKNSRQWLTKLLLSLLIATAPSAGAAAGPADCSPALAASQRPPPEVQHAGAPAFRIFWHVATQIEQLADARGDPQSIKTIRAVQPLVDGYYLNFLPGGPLAYWPKRPAGCSFNFVNAKMKPGAGTQDGIKTEKACAAAREKFMSQTAGGKSKPLAGLQQDAFKRAVETLDIATEQKSGKAVMAELLLVAGDFNYDEAAGRLSLNRLPKTLCMLNAIGITANIAMAYQEPAVQIPRQTFIWVPRQTPAGKSQKAPKPAADQIAVNPRLFGLVAGSFAAAGIPLNRFAIDIRRWNAKIAPQLYAGFKSSGSFDAYLFEGGTSIVPEAKNRLDNFIAGMSWILANTDRDIYLMMPGYWPPEETSGEAVIDGLIGRLRDLILTINQKLNESLKLPAGKNAICTGRFTLIPASYGAPIHVETFPAERDGHLAGTVTGQIKLLSSLRRELCGTGK